MKKQYKRSLEKKLTNMLIFMLREDSSNKEMYLDVKNSFTFSNKSISNLEEELKKVNVFENDDKWEQLTIFNGKIKLSNFKNKKVILFNHLRQLLLFCTLFRNKTEGEKLLLEKENFFSKQKSKSNDNSDNKEISDQLSKLMPGLGENIGNLVEDLSQELIPKLSQMDLSGIDITNPMSILSDIRFKGILEETGVKLKEKMRTGDIDEQELKSEITNIMPDTILNTMFSNMAKK